MSAVPVPDRQETDDERAAKLRQAFIGTLLAKRSAENRRVWAPVLAEVPREEFVPAYYERGPDDQWAEISGDNADQRRQWLRAVYQDQTLIIQLAEVAVPEQLGGGSEKIWTASSTAPSLMLRMLDDLELEPGQRVLEIGTGSGYNAALLGARVGGANVTTIDISPELTANAESRLACVHQSPTVVTGDGWDGWEPNAPYDRIIATCAVEAIPTAWIDQTVTGGIILTDWRRQIGGTLVKLRKHADGTASGRFTPEWGGFMYLRHTATGHAVPFGTAPAIVETDARTATTEVDPSLLLSDDRFVFLAQVYLPDCRIARTFWPDSADPAVRITADDGSWCEANCRSDQGRYALAHAGPRHLWRTIEEAHDWWHQNGKPSWAEFGMTATPTEQRIWFHTDDGDHQWPIPG